MPFPLSKDKLFKVPLGKTTPLVSVPNLKPFTKIEKSFNLYFTSTLLKVETEVITLLNIADEAPLTFICPLISLDVES